MKAFLRGLGSLFGKFGVRSSDDAELLAALEPEEPISPELAYAVVLVDLAMIDENIDERESEFIISSLQRLFGFERGKVNLLIQEATNLLAAYGGPQMFLDYLKKNLSRDKRLELLELVKAQIAVDGAEDGFETYLKERYLKLLGMA